MAYVMIESESARDFRITIFGARYLGHQPTVVISTPLGQHSLTLNPLLSPHTKVYFTMLLQLFVYR